MIGVLLGVLGSAASIVIWMVIASFLYCRLSGHLGLFTFPYNQWFQIAPYWTVTPWTQACVAISAAAASLPFVALGMAAYRWRSGRQRSLYGKTGWAKPEQMQQRGVRLNKDPF